LLVSVLAGCEPPRPGFLARLQQDCQTGDRDACGLLAGPATVHGSEQAAQPASRSRTPVQRDVDAIMQGMDHSRAETQTRVIPDDGG